MRWIVLTHLPAAAAVTGGLPWWAVLLALLSGHFLLLYGTLVPSARLFGPVLTTLREADFPQESSPTNRSPVWLTFDDGPDPATTPALLDLLSEQDARATFFLIGERATRHPDLVRAILAAGHGIGNHTHSHPAGSFWRLGPGAIEQEIAGCQHALDRFGKTPPILFRPPVGMHNPFVHPALRRHRLMLAGWSVRGFDGVPRPVDDIVRLLSKGLRPGAILLVHDARPTTIDVTRRLLELLDARHLAPRLPGFCAPPGELAPASPPTPPGPPGNDPDSRISLANDVPRD